MEVKDLFSPETSFFQKDLKTKDEVIKFLTNSFSKTKIITSKDVFEKAIKAREKEGSTGMGDGIAIPHVLDPTVQKSVVGFLTLKTPIEWGSLDDKPVDLIFLMATNGTDGNEHLTALANLSTYLMDKKTISAFKKVENFSQLKAVFTKFSPKKETEKVQPTVAGTLTTNGSFDVVGITACPTGIAHTYLAKDKLEEYANELGMSVKIETQGRRGVEDRLTPEEIKNAKVVILAHDKALEGLSRFNGVKVLDTSTKEVIYHGKDLIQNFASNPKTEIIKSVSANDTDETVGDLSLKKFKDVKGNLLGGVSRMLPFVVAGGIILGIGFLIDFIAGNGNAGSDFGTVNKAAGWFSAIGKTSMAMMVPILGGYIAYSIVGPQGLMPGIVAGLLADDTVKFAYGKLPDDKWSGLWRVLFSNSDIKFNSGFIGAMVGGYLAALIVFYLTKSMAKFGRSFQGVRDIVLIPVSSLSLIALLMFAINIPLGYLMYGIEKGLEWLADHNLLLILGGLIGLMMCIDMGGPINKIAYTVGVAASAGKLGNSNNPEISVIMAAAMAAGMIPPLGIALCTTIFKKVWTSKERDAAKANWLMGAFFITEGAIPFMVTDSKRISVSALSGGFVTGLLVGAFKITLKAPHGGICVFPLLDSRLFTSPGMMKGMGIALYILAIIIGVTIMAGILGFWKLHDMKKTNDPILIANEQDKTQVKKKRKMSK